MRLINKARFDRARESAASAFGVLIWTGIWAINGYFTVVAVNAIGRWLASSPTATSDLSVTSTILGNILANAVIAWIMHIIGSGVEGFSWKNLRKRAGLTFVLVLMVDIATTYSGIAQIVAERGASVSGSGSVLVVAIALCLGLLPEMMIVKHLQDLGVIGE